LLKPDTEFFLHALREADVRPSDAIMVGDTYKNDILPAIELGMKTVWVLHRPDKERTALVQVLNGDAPAPSVTLSSIGELCADLLRRLERDGNPQV
jgi:FMN phosphatase YigB (HAD superfamily)